MVPYNLIIMMKNNEIIHTPGLNIRPGGLMAPLPSGMPYLNTSETPSFKEDLKAHLFNIAHT